MFINKINFFVLFRVRNARKLWWWKIFTRIAAPTAALERIPHCEWVFISGGLILKFFLRALLDGFSVIFSLTSAPHSSLVFLSSHRRGTLWWTRKKHERWKQQSLSWEMMLSQFDWGWGVRVHDWSSCAWHRSRRTALTCLWIAWILTYWCKQNEKSPPVSWCWGADSCYKFNNTRENHRNFILQF